MVMQENFRKATKVAFLSTLREGEYFRFVSRESLLQYKYIGLRNGWHMVMLDEKYYYFADCKVLRRRRRFNTFFYL